MGLKTRKRTPVELLETHFAEALQLAFQSHFEEPVRVEYSTLQGIHEVQRVNGKPLTKTMDAWVTGFVHNHLRVCAFLRKYK